MKIFGWPFKQETALVRTAARGVVWLVALCAPQAFAGPLAIETASIAGFHGTTLYQAYDLNNNPTGLFGAIDYAVWSPGTFPASYSNFSASDYVYAYQVRETGPEFLSSLSIELTGPADTSNIGDFVGDDGFGLVDGAHSIVAHILPLDSAIWYFDGIGPGNSSDGLAFSSAHGPIFSRSSTIGDGSIAFSLPIPSTNPQNVPEPGTLILGLCGIGVLVFQWHRRRARNEKTRFPGACRSRVVCAIFHDLNPTLGKREMIGPCGPFWPQTNAATGAFINPRVFDLGRSERWPNISKGSCLPSGSFWPTSPLR
ncbi:MAG: PEP-CTERM sorting domain-containing protein [Planctomycetia bacterium]|nr:PEP-CTERM sorting domain-containing protein [Planctomycetia bacterium]